MSDRGTSIIEAINSSPLNRGLDGAQWLATPGNIPVLSGDNITLFDYEGDDTYEVHFLYKSTGKEAIRCAKAAFGFLFEYHHADTIFGMVPDHLRHAKIHARLVGGKSVGVRETAFGPCELFVLSRDMWKGPSE